MKEIIEVGFINNNYISVDKKPPVSSFGEIKPEDKNTARFNILSSLL